MNDISPQQPPTEPIEILLVEDNPGDVRLLREAFKSTDRQTTFQVVRDGDEAVVTLAQQSEHGTLPDLVLLDLNLPGRNGLDVLQAIRDDPRLVHLPVIVLTSSEAEEDVARCYDADANAYLTKPSDPITLFDLMDEVERFWLEHARLPPTSA